MISTEIFNGNIGGEGVVAFETNAFDDATFKYSFTAQLRCLKPVPGQAGMPRLKIFHNAFPLFSEVDSPGSDFGVEDVDELGTCMHQEWLELGPSKLNPDFKWIFKTGCYHADGTQVISWLESANIPEEAYHLILFLNEITFPAA